jgi:phenylacetate-coenzyme A ligase PaaK-like adenylate-forming protein
LSISGVGSNAGDSHIRYRPTEVRVIQQIERFAADTKNRVFARSKLPAERKVDIEIAGAAETVVPGVSECTRRFGGDLTVKHVFNR